MIQFTNIYMNNIENGFIQETIIMCNCNTYPKIIKLTM